MAPIARTKEQVLRGSDPFESAEFPRELNTQITEDRQGNRIAIVHKANSNPPGWFRIAILEKGKKYWDTIGKEQ